jgi:hypothetical protein
MRGGVTTERERENGVSWALVVGDRSIRMSFRRIDVVVVVERVIRLKVGVPTTVPLFTLGMAIALFGGGRPFLAAALAFSLFFLFLSRTTLAGLAFSLLFTLLAAIARVVGFVVTGMVIINIVIIWIITILSVVIVAMSITRIIDHWPRSWNGQSGRPWTIVQWNADRRLVNRRTTVWS